MKLVAAATCVAKGWLCRQSTGAEDEHQGTAMHPQIQKYVRVDLPETTHHYNLWHVAKGV